jgi:glycosyltransferase involved in cell wall biosynthesis
MSGRDRPRLRFFNPTPLQYWGGGEVIELALINHFAASGYHVSATTASNREITERVALNEILQVLRASYSATPFQRYCGLKDRIQVRCQHLPSYDDLADSDLSLLMVYRVPPRRFFDQLPRSGPPVLIMVHGVALERFRAPNLTARLYQRILNRTLSDLAIATKHPRVYIQVLTAWIRQSLLQRGAINSKVFHIANGVSEKSFHVERGGERFSVLFMGRLEQPQKGMPLLIQLARRIEEFPAQDIDLSIVGSGTWSRRLEAKFANAKRVSVRGFVGSDDKIRLLARSHLFVSTSNLEPYPVAILEGLISGLPIVTTPTVGPTEIVGRNQSFGIVTSFSPDSLFGAIRDYACRWRREPQEYYRAKLERSALASKTFSDTRMLAAYEEAARTILTVPNSYS